MKPDLPAIEAENEKLKNLRIKAVAGPWKSYPSPVDPKLYRYVAFGPNRDEPYGTSSLSPQEANFIAYVGSKDIAGTITELLAYVRQLEADLAFIASGKDVEKLKARIAELEDEVRCEQRQCIEMLRTANSPGFLE